MDEETYSTEAAICPYCGHRNDPSDSDGALYDEMIDLYECGECEREFRVSIYTRTSWSCRPVAS